MYTYWFYIIDTFNVIQPIFQINFIYKCTNPKNKIIMYNFDVKILRILYFIFMKRMHKLYTAWIY